MRFCDKDEIYSSEELSAVRAAVLETLSGKSMPEDGRTESTVQAKRSAAEKLTRCLDLLSGRDGDSGILFMPESGFGIISRIIGDAGLGGPTSGDVRVFIRALGSSKNLAEKDALRLSGKLGVLLEFLDGGNRVSPVVVSVDRLSES